MTTPIAVSTNHVARPAKLHASVTSTAKAAA